MDDSPGMHLVVTVDDLIHERNSLSLGDGPLTADCLGKVTSLAQLRNDVGVVPGVVDVIDFDNVIAILETFENFDL